MSKKRRTSHMSIGSMYSGVDMLQLSKGRRSISKSRRSSAVDEKPPSRRTSLAAALSLLSLPSFMDESLVNVLDVHALYKVKVDRSSKKLECFFGEPSPIDVCVSEIMKEGLKAMLESKVPLCYFLFYLLDEFSSENLFFFMEVECFEQIFKNKNISLAEQERKAQKIFDQYISSNASFEINLDDRVKRTITSRFLSKTTIITADTFNEAKTSVYVLLESSFIRFLHTYAYKDMLENCGELTIHYDEQVTTASLNYLVQYLRSQRENLMLHSENNTAFSSTLVSLNLKHYELIKSAVQGFIKTLFGIDYLSNKNSWSSSFSTAKKPNKKKHSK
ncbi:RGS domain-containing protein [Mucor mucedo]|uniref:RGS domain-containing protein n=1 Tax=Mucor mucedo TaxID=29922 RepID=UPI0022211D55|nr:RGS domain-containing protein [Mucor mucedo]KAI7896822.1 RGS domain-containing protein [Mucor mucedo]